MSGCIVRMSCGDSIMSLDEVAYYLRNMDARLVSDTDIDAGDTRMILLNFEKFYLRSKNYAGLSVLLTERGAAQSADVTGFAGGLGILDIHWGVNDEIAGLAVNVLRRCGFTEE